MEYSVKPRYKWSHWLWAAFFLGLFVYMMFSQIQDFLRQYNQASISVEEKHMTIYFAIFYGMAVLCFSVNFLATSIKKISIAGERVELHKMMSRAISVGIQEITMYADVLYIKELYRIQMGQMRNREELRALLAGHVNVVHDKKSVLNLWQKLLILLSIIIAILIIVLSLTLPILMTDSGTDRSLFAFSAKVLVVILLLTFKNLLIQ